VSSGTANDTSSNPTNFGIEGHKRQIEDFVQAILENRPPLVDQHAGRQAVDLILAIYESSKTGKTVYIN
jgi:UDP-N-acetyl-2-amino-2-deoxyglucuronate dehydrogenase